jgi:LuxR family maltose regulon positive regulatory protein
MTGVPIRGGIIPRGALFARLSEAGRVTVVSAPAVRALTPAPTLDGGAVVEHLLEDLGSIETPLWLVIDDLHELRSLEALRDLALLAMRAAPELRFVFSTRGELPLGLHRLRLEGALTEVRADDLRFSLDEARELFERAGVLLSERALVRLYERTEELGRKALGIGMAGERQRGQPQARAPAPRAASASCRSSSRPAHSWSR